MGHQAMMQDEMSRLVDRALVRVGLWIEPVTNEHYIRMSHDERSQYFAAMRRVDERRSTAKKWAWRFFWAHYAFWIGLWILSQVAITWLRLNGGE